jgi:hypothetical protein
MIRSGALGERPLPGLDAATPLGERLVADDIDLQVLLCGESTLELWLNAR